MTSAVEVALNPNTTNKPLWVQVSFQNCIRVGQKSKSQLQVKVTRARHFVPGKPSS